MEVKDRINAAHVLCHTGTIAPATNKAVVSLEVDGEWLACATADCVSAWLIREEEGRSLLPTEAMRHECDGEQRRVVTHLALRGGLVLAAGQSRVAKRRREKKGVVSQINPGVFVLACDVGSGGVGVLGETRDGAMPHALVMTDVELPSIMAMWERLSGIATVVRAGGRVVLLADTEGQVVRWTLEDRKNSADATPAVLQSPRGAVSRPARGSSGCERASDCAPPNIVIARCATLPPATGYGQLKNITTCGQDDRYVVGAAQQAVLVPPILAAECAAQKKRQTCLKTCTQPCLFLHKPDIFESGRNFPAVLSLEVRGRTAASKPHARLYRTIDLRTNLRVVQGVQRWMLLRVSRTAGPADHLS